MRLIDESRRIIERLRNDPELAQLIHEIDAAKATPELVQAARDEYQNEDIEVDDDATTSRTDTGTWVSAWVWVPDDEDDEEDEDDETEPKRLGPPTPAMTGRQLQAFEQVCTAVSGMLPFERTPWIDKMIRGLTNGPDHRYSDAECVFISVLRNAILPD
jgi:hypothetical protein